MQCTACVPPQSQGVLRSPSLLLHCGNECHIHFLCLQGTHVLYRLDLTGGEQFAISGTYIVCEKKVQVLA